MRMNLAIKFPNPSFLLALQSYSNLLLSTQAQCTGNGLMDCACNFINACTWNPATQTFSAFSGSTTNLIEYLPNDLRKLAKNSRLVAEICEPGLIGILYDCENRIPVASTIVMKPDQYEHEYLRPPIGFRPSNHLHKDFQQNHRDYKGASIRVPCYETCSSTRPEKYVENNWYRALERGKSLPLRSLCTTRKPSPIAKGHLVAAQYGRGMSSRTRETFVYTNSVPQFVRLNSGDWRQHEQRLTNWARENCNGGPLHIVVGSIPSTFGKHVKRFSGEAGFSDYIGRSKLDPLKDPYRINVPACMWTAACCYASSNTRSTAFYAENLPGYGLVKRTSVFKLSRNIIFTDVIKIFPKMPSCHDMANHVPLI